MIMKQLLIISIAFLLLSPAIRGISKYNEAIDTIDRLDAITDGDIVNILWVYGFDIDWYDKATPVDYWLSGLKPVKFTPTGIIERTKEVKLIDGNLCRKFVTTDGFTNGTTWILEGEYWCKGDIINKQK